MNQGFTQEEFTVEFTSPVINRPESLEINEMIFISKMSKRKKKCSVDN